MEQVDHTFRHIETENSKEHPWTSFRGWYHHTPLVGNLEKRSFLSPNIQPRQLLDYPLYRYWKNMSGYPYYSTSLWSTRWRFCIFKLIYWHSCSHRISRVICDVMKLTSSRPAEAVNWILHQGWNVFVRAHVHKEDKNQLLRWSVRVPWIARNLDVRCRSFARRLAGLPFTVGTPRTHRTNISCLICHSKSFSRIMLVHVTNWTTVAHKYGKMFLQNISIFSLQAQWRRPGG